MPRVPRSTQWSETFESDRSARICIDQRHRDDQGRIRRFIPTGRPSLGVLKRLARVGDLDPTTQHAHWSAYCDDPEVRLRVLRAIARFGFALLHGTPVEEGTVLDVAASFGYVRETNYGELFDVRIEANPNNLAFTGAAISPHTDNPYRDPVPTVQLLHCISNDVEGGESGLVDGFEAAATLRDEDLHAFEVLSSTPVTFAWGDANTSLHADRPMIELDPLGQIRSVRFNNRSLQTLR